MPASSLQDPLLLPRPARLERHGGTVAVPDLITAGGDLSVDRIRTALDRPVAPAPIAPWLSCRLALDARATPEGYMLRIADESGKPPVSIAAGTPAGLLNGLRTLRQLLRQYGPALPSLHVRDSPAFATRAVMLDVSRDRVPTMEELFRVVDQLAALKFNHLQLYTEHTFAYAGHEEVWREWSPLTPDEIKRLDGHCRARAVLLAANQNCFGHLASWLKHPRYMPLAEIQGPDTEWDFYEWRRRGPFSLCPIDDGSIALVRNLLDQLLPCFSSGLVNINCDETADVGQGRSREAVARRGRAPVYFNFVGRVVAEVRRHGFRPMFWADFPLAHPGSIPLMPPDLLALAWGYEPDTPFQKWCSLLRDAGREAWVCPGTCSWRSITGRTRERCANIGAAASAGAGGGATGLLVCDWGDLGHRQQWPVALNALAFAADAAWRGTTEGYDARAPALHAFGDDSLRVASWLDELGDIDGTLRATGGRRDASGRPTPLRNASALFTDLHEPLAVAVPADGKAWHEVLERLDALGRAMPAIAPDRLDDELRHSLAVARFAAERAALRRAPAGISAGDARRLAGVLREIMDAHRALWLGCSRPGGLEHSLWYYRSTLQELESAR